MLMMILLFFKFKDQLHSFQMSSSNTAHRYEALQGPDVFLHAGKPGGERLWDGSRRPQSFFYVWVIMVLFVVEALFIGLD